MNPDLAFSQENVPGTACPYCKRDVQGVLVGLHTKLGQRERMIDETVPYKAWCIVRCPRGECGNIFYLTVSGICHERGRVHSANPVAVWPPPDKKLNEHIPEDVRVDYGQAYRCWTVMMDRAATLMLRRCVENACVICEAKGDDLYQKIEDLKAKNKLHPINADSAHKARILGRDVAHILREVKSEEVIKCLFLIEKILDDLFVVPAIQQEIGEKKSEPT